jgi:hypothetical protein
MCGDCKLADGDKVVKNCTCSSGGSTGDGTDVCACDSRATGDHICTTCNHLG